MVDPYILNNGTLQNLLGIVDEEELKQAEADIGFVKLINVKSCFSRDFDANFFRQMHKHIFSDIFEWAGEYRTTPLYKEEIVIPGLSLEYAKPEDIDTLLQRRIEDLNNTDWHDKDVNELSLMFAKKLAAIWRIHPFRDGNTRTTLAFADIYSRLHGFPFNMQVLLDHLNRKQDENGKVVRYSIRDKFVLAALDDNCYPEPEHLAAMLKSAIMIGPLPKLKSNKDEEER